MLVSTKGRYALRVMLELAQDDSAAYLPLPAIAERQGISEKYLESIISVLSKAGLVDGLRGKGGGYRLNRPAALHCCRAWGTLAGMLKEYPRLKAVLHGWTGALNPGAQLPSGNWLLSVGPREMDRPGLLSSIPLHRLALESDEHPEALPELYRNAAQALSMKEEELAALVADNMERISAR